MGYLDGLKFLNTNNSGLSFGAGVTPPNVSFGTYAQPNTSTIRNGSVLGAYDSGLNYNFPQPPKPKPTITNNNPVPTGPSEAEKIATEAAARSRQGMLDRIGASFGSLRNQARSTLDRNLDLLEGRKGETEQTYDVANTNRARLLGDQQRFNRQASRAGGNLSSSYYQNMQNAAAEDATSDIGNLNTERQLKLDALGNAIVNQKSDTENYLSQLLGEEELAKRDAENQYSNTLDQIALTNLENAYNQRLANTANSYASKFASNPLDQISKLLSVNRAIEAANAPIANENYLANAYDDLESGNDSYESIRGYLNSLDTRNSTNLEDQFVKNTYQEGKWNPFVPNTYKVNQNAYRPTPQPVQKQLTLEDLYSFF